jgi:hypothetical protein
MGIWGVFERGRVRTRTAARRDVGCVAEDGHAVDGCVC